MKRLCVVQQAIHKFHEDLTPITTILLEDIKSYASQFIASDNGEGKYQVKYP